MQPLATRARARWAKPANVEGAFSRRARASDSALVLALLASTLAGSSAFAQSPQESADSGPGLCVAATSAAVDPDAWSDIFGQIKAAIERRPAFFPSAIIASVPDLGPSLDVERSPTVTIGVWGHGGDGSGSVEQGRERLSGAACQRGGNAWAASISRHLLVDGAQGILAAARTSVDGAEPQVPVDAETLIDVELYPSEGRVRTFLDFTVPLGFIRVDGQCWIDDALDVDTGRVVLTSSSGRSGLASSGCDEFEAFMTAGGAGEQGIDLLPLEFSLLDGTVVNLKVKSVRVGETAIVLVGTVERR